MAKRRSRKEKLQAKHPFLISWESGGSGSSHTPVKRQSPAVHESDSSATKSMKKAKRSEKDSGFGLIRKDIIKSISLACIIISLEVVLYLAWR